MFEVELRNRAADLLTKCRAKGVRIATVSTHARTAASPAPSPRPGQSPPTSIHSSPHSKGRTTRSLVTEARRRSQA